eukprot:13357595-Alexandrium_andersonii.AAC.1
MYLLPPDYSPGMRADLARSFKPAPPWASACFYDENLTPYRFTGTQIVVHRIVPIRIGAVWG